jgi:hypothetical protein
MLLRCEIGVPQSSFAGSSNLGNVSMLYWGVKFLTVSMLVSTFIHMIKQQSVLELLYFPHEDTTVRQHICNLYNKTNEMYFIDFNSDNILYMFRIGKLFIFRRNFYCTCSLWCVPCWNTLILFKLYVVIKSKNHIVYEIIYKMLIIKLFKNSATIRLANTASHPSRFE